MVILHSTPGYQVRIDRSYLFTCTTQLYTLQHKYRSYLFSCTTQYYTLAHRRTRTLTHLHFCSIYVCGHSRRHRRCLREPSTGRRRLSCDADDRQFLSSIDLRTTSRAAAAATTRAPDDLRHRLDDPTAGGHGRSRRAPATTGSPDGRRPWTWPGRSTCKTSPPGAHGRGRERRTAGHVHDLLYLTPSTA